MACPYQSSAPLRERINDGRVAFVDMHLSHVPQSVLFGFFGKIDFAVIEASRVTSDGRVFLTTSVGASPTFLQAADKVIIELNRNASTKISEMADIVIPKPPPFRPAIDLDFPLQRIGKTYARVDPEKIVGIVETDQPDELTEFVRPGASCNAIARHVVRFLLEEMASGRIPPDMLPIQAGVGNVANAVLSGLGKHPDIPELTMYTEVFQSAAFELMTQERICGASTTALTLTPQQMTDLIDEIDYYAPRIILRPQEISNNPAAVRQVGVIALNTALEFDLSGHVNSTHVMGRRLINGIGGSGDFARNAYLSIFMCPSIVKDGTVSTVVPMCPHVDHNEHSVNVVVTEQGLADLRGPCAGRPRRTNHRELCPPALPRVPAPVHPRCGTGTHLATIWDAASSCIRTCSATARCCPTRRGHRPRPHRPTATMPRRTFRSAALRPLRRDVFLSRGESKSDDKWRQRSRLFAFCRLACATPNEGCAKTPRKRRATAG